jgi:hypothetical protein
MGHSDIANALMDKTTWSFKPGLRTKGANVRKMTARAVAVR